MDGPIWKRADKEAEVATEAAETRRGGVGESSKLIAKIGEERGYGQG